MAEPVWDLPPAAEVRRRGDRIARRRAWWAMAAGTTVAAAIVVPLALARPAADPPRPPVATDAPAPAPEWHERVPGGIDLTAGMTSAAPSVLAGADDEAVRAVTVCGAGRWVRGLPAGATDGRVATGAAEQRVLLVYRDDTTARAAFAEVRRTAGGCGSGDRLLLPGEVGGPGADESWGLVLAGPDGAESVFVVRVGNAVLLDHATEPAAEAPEVAARLAERAEPAVEQLCVFGGERC